MKENQRVFLTKRLIKEGLLRLVKIKALDKITVSELCKESGINRATFYRHYEVPRDVLQDIEQELVQNLHIKDRKMSSMQDVERCAEDVLIYLYENSELLTILIKNRSDEKFARMINDLYDMINRTKKEVYGLNDLDDDSTKLLSAYAVGGIYFLLRQWIVTGMNKTPKEISALIVRFLDKDL